MVCLLQLALTTPSAEGAAPDRFGSYSISRLPDGTLRELGRGAMGMTFHATDTALQRPVALKIIDTDFATRGDSADLLGGGVLIPQGTVIDGGVAFTGTANDGGTFRGIYKNDIGAGYSVLDGYGFIYAQKAVRLPLPSMVAQPFLNR